MVSNVATHASPVPSRSSLDAKSSAAEPGFQTAISSSAQAAGSGEHAASLNAAGPGTVRRQPNEPERGRPEKKNGATGIDPAGSANPDPLPGQPTGDLAFSLPLSPVPVSELPAAAMDGSPAASQPIESAAALGGVLPALSARATAQAVTPDVSLSTEKPSETPDGMVPLDGKTTATQSANGALQYEASSDRRADTRDDAASAIPAKLPPFDDAASSLAVNVGRTAAHAIAAAPVHALHGLNPASSGIAGSAPSPSTGALGYMQGSNTGGGKTQTGSDGSRSNDGGAESPGVSADPGSGFSQNPTASAVPLVHAPPASVENTGPAGGQVSGPAIDSLAVPVSSQVVASRPESFNGGGSGELSADRLAVPGASQGAEPQPINTARVLQSMNGTEMRVGIHSQEFGSISIATSVSPGGVAAQIALDHGALSRALATHLPGIEDRLGSALGVSARVEVRDGGAHTSQRDDAQASGGNASAQSGSQRGSQNGQSGEYASSRFAETAYAVAAPDGAMLKAGEGGRLSVQA